MLSLLAITLSGIAILQPFDLVKATESSGGSFDVSLDSGSVDSTPGSTRSLQNAPQASLSVSRQGDGTLRLSEVSDSEKRPFRIVYYYRFDASESQENREYIEGELMPAAASYLRRWIRVRLQFQSVHNDQPVFEITCR